MTTQLPLPDLSRYSRAIRSCAYSDFDFTSAFEKFHTKFGGGPRSNTDLNQKLFARQFNPQDATYRRDFLGEWLENPAARKGLDSAYNKLPHSDLRCIIVETNWGRPLTPSAIQTQITTFKRYIALPQTLEMIAQIPGSSQGMRDLHQYATHARSALDQFNKTAIQIRNSPQYSRSDFDISWANSTIERISEFVPRLEEIRNLRYKLLTYKQLCIPYEIPCTDKSFTYCKPEFMDSEINQGKIIGALNPKFFKFGEVTINGRQKYAIKRVNVANDISWGPNARANYIHGTNSNGKSVYLDTIALNVHLAMAGLYCFAQECKLTLPNQLFSCLDTGDDWDAGHLETTGRKIKYMIRRATSRDLVFIDECGSGTEPEAERLVAKGLTDGLLRAGIPFFAVTHDRGSWTDSLGKPGVRILRVADSSDKKRKFKVWPGIAPTGYGLEFAKKLGIDPQSIAKSLSKRIK